MSFVAIVIVFGHAALFGIDHETDEGTPAHIFQLLILAQVPLVAYFAMRWLPEAPREAAQILALQAGAVLVAFSGVFFFTT